MRADRCPVHAGIGPLDFAVARLDRPVVERIVLQRALACLVADRAVERMVDEEELHRPLARLVDFLVPDVDFHPVAHGRGAAGLELRHPFDFHEAHAALADDAQRRVITEVRDVDVGCLGRFDDVDSVLNVDLDSVNCDLCHRVFSACSDRTRAASIGRLPVKNFTSGERILIRSASVNACERPSRAVHNVSGFRRRREGERYAGSGAVRSLPAASSEQPREREASAVSRRAPAADVRAREVCRIGGSNLA